MKIKYLVVIFAWFSFQFLFAGTGKDVAVEITIQNQVRQTLDNVLMDYLIPNGLGLSLHREDWTGSISYENNSYFIQRPAMNISVFKNTHTIFGKVGILASVNRIIGIEHYFQDHVRDKESPKAYRQTYDYLMTEIGFGGQEFSINKIVGFEGSIRLGTIYELKGLADISKYARTPLKFWINIRSFRPGISWDYIVHDSMEGWDVDNIKIFMVYIL